MVKIKNLVYLLSFIMLYFIGDRIIANQLYQVVKSSQFRFSEIYNGNQKNEILILGNSRGVNSFYVPELNRRLNKKVFNLSYNGMDMEIVKILFYDYLEKNQKPQQLIIEISNILSVEPLSQKNQEAKIDVEDIGLAGDLKVYSPHSHRIRNMVGKRSPNLIFWSDISNISIYNGEMFLRIINYLKSSDQNWSNGRTITNKMLEVVNYEPNYICKLSKHQINELQEILAFARKNNIDVKLVVGPYLPVYRDKILNYSETIANLSNQLTSNEFGSNLLMDYSKSINDSNKFADKLHANTLGSKEMIGVMIKDGLFVKK
jgi:hypothetical protein